MIHCLMGKSHPSNGSEQSGLFVDSSIRSAIYKYMYTSYLEEAMPREAVFTRK